MDIKQITKLCSLFSKFADEASKYSLDELSNLSNDDDAGYEVEEQDSLVGKMIMLENKNPVQNTFGDLDDEFNTLEKYESEIEKHPKEYANELAKYVIDSVTAETIFNEWLSNKDENTIIALDAIFDEIYNGNDELKKMYFDYFTNKHYEHLIKGLYKDKLIERANNEEEFAVELMMELGLDNDDDLLLEHAQKGHATYQKLLSHKNPKHFDYVQSEARKGAPWAIAWMNDFAEEHEEKFDENFNFMDDDEDEENNPW